MRAKHVPIAILIGSALVMSGCATHPKNIQPAYVSPLQYKNYDCNQIAEEMDYVSHATVKLYNDLKSEANKDAVVMGAGLVLFWPVLFALSGGDGPEAAQYAELKGRFEALRKVAIRKKCDLEMKSPERIIDEKRKENIKKIKNNRDELSLKL